MKFKGKLPEITLKYKTGDMKKFKVSDAESCYGALKYIYDADTIEYCESFIVLFLNNHNNTIGWIKISQGGITGTIVDRRMIFATALKCGATSIILSHNHPSGNTTPSDADIRMTKEVIKGGETLDIKVLDHIIVTKNSYTSMTNEGLI